MKITSKRRAPAVLLFGLLTLTACSSPTESYVTADRETLDKVGVDYEAYVKADTQLTTEARNRRLLTVETWRERVRKAEATFK